MAKKKEEMGVPAIVDSVETLEAKMKAMREAQKNLQNSLRSRLIRFSMKQQWQLTRCVSRLLKWQ